MSRLTRSSARRGVSPNSSSGTPTTNPSPIFSARTSIKAESETPVTSDGEDTLLKSTIAITKSVKTVASRAVKRKLQSEELDDDDEDVENAVEILSVSTRASKRRVSTNRAYIEVPVKTPTPSRSTSAAASAPAAKGKGKAKAPRTPTPEPEFDEDDDEDKASIEESDVSGSEFEGSDDSEAEDDDFDDDSEAEEVMLTAAIQASLKSASASTKNGEGSSSSAASPTRRSAAALRAAAAERRIARQQGLEVSFDVDDSQMEVDDDESLPELNEDEESALSSADDEPLASPKGKGKAKAKGKQPAKKVTSTPKVMTMAQLRKARREENALKKDSKKMKKQEERKLALELGRPLTHAEKTGLALRTHHPELRDIWGDLEAAKVTTVPEKADQPEGLKVILLPFQRESLAWMRKQEKSIWGGGILADEMGMGKTIQMISLMFSDGAKPNLVIAPTVAIMQWKNEIALHTHGMKVLVWHGSSRESNSSEFFKFDVVLTTYAVVESSFRKQQSGFKRKGMIVKEKSPLHQIKWNRVILDEAHNIKERSTNTAKAAFELKSNYRWCLSGTPLQNRVGEMYSLIRFLGGDPFAYYFCKLCDCKSLHWKFSNKRTCDDCHHSPMQHTCFWNNEILTPIQKHGMGGGGPGKNAFKKLRVLLDQIMLRRTKLERADDLGLPPRTVIVRRDYFSPEEKELYLSLFSDAKRQFSTYLDQGTVLNNYSNIFSLLTRMRQMACHPDLVIRSKANVSTFVPDEAGEATVCRLCNEFAEDAIQSKCHHVFDRECIKQYLEASLENTQPDCPVCHLPLTIDLEAPALEIEQTTTTARQGILGRLNLDTWRSSSKIEALVEELSNLRLKDATTKSIVFSQFVNFLDLIAYRLQKAGFTVCRLEGTMSPQARDATIKHFMNNVEVTVFLVSLKAGGVALNLTEASRVYLMDSWWNPAVEFQAMDRIHRLGQRRPVEAIKLVVEDSIESRIVQLQEKKSAMIDATLSTDDSAMGRLTPEDVSR
ncbi:DNA repair protein rad16 [Ephemerocybe angulata]|uniref:DNA repair protein rad16 n=1 Tax=Ephemerocybe angulata TaxID=980116 RepID=A0A8H6IDZ8_9AGAR|nr:DNA repair protein rad16 [Tulosesus angulatus]